MIRVGEGWVSLERREVITEHGPVRLGSRAFDVLETLLAAPNRLVTKEELLCAVWPDTVVEENNLQVHISTLRKALKLDRNMLETVARRGYRLNLHLPEQPAPSAFSLASQTFAATAPALVQRLANVHVVDDEPAVRAALVRQLRSFGLPASGYETAEAFLAQCNFDEPGCLLLDVRLHQGSGFDLQAELTRRQAPMPIVFITGFGTIDMSVRAMKAGAEGFLTKPFDEQQLLATVRDAMEQAVTRHAHSTQRAGVSARFAGLTAREQQVFDLLLLGQMNKDIARQLDLQEVTVKVHKKHIMTKLGTRTLVDLLLVGKMLGKLPELQQRPHLQA
jgi:FixJ family two-component response regulator/DNA-binding winged helix-turn-helix (wHTH) protein